jgi:hypothetical protein
MTEPSREIELAGEIERAGGYAAWVMQRDIARLDRLAAVSNNDPDWGVRARVQVCIVAKDMAFANMNDPDATEANSDMISDMDSDMDDSL